MKKLLTLLFSLAATVAFAQFTAPGIQWQKSLGGRSGLDYAYAIRQTTDGGYIVAGGSRSVNGDVSGNHGNYDYWVVKLDATGILQWQKPLGGINPETAYAVWQTMDGGYVIAGNSFSYDGDVTVNHGKTDYWIVKLNDTGTLEWQKTMGGTEYDYATAMKQTADGGYILAGYSNSNNGDVTGNHGSYDYWVVKLDDTGSIQWQKSLGGTNDDRAFAVQQTADGGYIVAGNSRSNNGNVTGNHGGSYDYWVVKLNDTGALQWQKSLGGTDYDYATAVQQTTDGGYIVAGYSQSLNYDRTNDHGYNYDCWVVKLNDTGALEWQKALGGTGTDAAAAIQQASDGGYIIAGYSGSVDGDVTGNHGAYDYWVVKLNDTGALQWQKSLGGTDYEEASAIQQTSDGGYVIAGNTQSKDGDVANNPSGYGYWVVKLAPDPAAVSTPTAPASVSLFPNPATTEVRIQTNEIIRSVLLTDISGKEVFRGGSTTVIPTAALANGLYLVRVQTDKGATIQKVLVQHP